MILSRGRSALARARELLRGTSARYDPQHYWAGRLKQWGESLRGPGRGDLSEEANVVLYQQGAQALGEMMDDLSVRWDSRFAEIGPGNGYWLRWLINRGVRTYTAYDITDVLFADLRHEWPNADLHVKDITEEPIDDLFDVVLMIDVTQHIVREDKFKRAMKNCREAVRPGGHFIVTSWLQPYYRFAADEVFRPLECYTQIFRDWKLTGPKSFRDKFVFGFSRPQ